MPSDRDREMAAQCWCAPSTSRIEMDARLAGVVSEAIAQARAEGFREGIERAAKECDRVTDSASFRPSNIRLIGDATAECAQRIRALAPQQEIEAGAKAEDPGGRGESGGGDATEADALRRLLWLRHGCVGLYGDDGEMQCGHCRIDFKRDPVEQISVRFQQRAPEPSAPPLDRTPPAGATLSPTARALIDAADAWERAHACGGTTSSLLQAILAHRSSQPERSGEGAR